MRSGKTTKRLIKPDSLYHSVLVAKLINRVMMDGKKATAQSLVYKALEQVKEETKSEPLSVLEKAIENITPKMEVRPRRVGGASYQVPMEVRGDRKETLAIRWLILASRDRSNKEYHSFDQKLAAEIMDGAKETGGAFKKKEDMQKVAAANRAFAHFRW
ncbi:MAG: 30S ribosomal protein S7 [Candidatus Daviesbacteria bacterium]|nr:MAG: 30S ribosomal protein S7 [Candidatus Daviesbacteria bacterium]